MYNILCMVFIDHVITVLSIGTDVQEELARFPHVVNSDVYG